MTTIRKRIGDEWVDAVGRVAEETKHISWPLFNAALTAPLGEAREHAWLAYHAAEAVRMREFRRLLRAAGDVWHAKIVAFTSSEIDGEIE